MTTGAGSEGAGGSLSGFDALAVGEADTKSTIPAMRYEGSTKDWSMVGSKFEPVTANEQAVVLSIAVKQGSVKSSPSTGCTLHEIKYLGSSSIATDVSDRVYNSNPLARLLAEGRVSIEKIDHQVSKYGLKVAVYFKDLEVDPNKLAGPVVWSQ